MSIGEVLEFEVDGVRYALPASQVREVVRAVAVTSLPGAPPAVAGVIDIRGGLAPVYDVRARLGFPGKAVHPADHFVIATAAGRTVVLHVDRVHSISHLPAGSVERARDLAEGNDYIAGVAKLPDGLVLIQDLPRFLSPTEEAELVHALENRRGAIAPP